MSWGGGAGGTAPCEVRGEAVLLRMRRRHSLVQRLPPGARLRGVALGLLVGGRHGGKCSLPGIGAVGRTSEGRGSPSPSLVVGRRRSSPVVVGRWSSSAVSAVLGSPRSWSRSQGGASGGFAPGVLYRLRESCGADPKSGAGVLGSSGGTRALGARMLGNLCLRLLVWRGARRGWSRAALAEQSGSGPRSSPNFRPEAMFVKIQALRALGRSDF